MKQVTKQPLSRDPEIPRCCNVCGGAPAPVRLPFAVGCQDTPPFARESRFLGVGPRKKRFYQRHRWVWSILWLCRACGASPPSDRLWNTVQNHPVTRELVQNGFNETRLGPDFSGREGDVTFTEEPV